MKFNRSAKGRRVVKGPAGRRRARNPVKSLQARTDLRDSYSQVHHLINQSIIHIDYFINKLINEQNSYSKVEQLINN